MGLVKNGFIDLGNGFFINDNLVANNDTINKTITLKSGETYKYGELPLPTFLMNGRYCYDLYDTQRKVDKMNGEEYGD